MNNLLTSCKAAIAKCQPEVRHSNTIQSVIIYWNQSVEQSGLTGKYDFPRIGYNRFSVLLADLNRVLSQLETLTLKDRLEVLENNSDGLSKDTQPAEMEAIPSQLFPAGVRPEYPTISQEAFAEAIITNARTDATTDAIAQWHASDPVTACEHAAHLINDAIDCMVSERQHIDVCQYEDHEETFRLVSLGYEYKNAGHEWYRWAKATAIRLWEKGYVVD